MNTESCDMQFLWVRIAANRLGDDDCHGGDNLRCTPITKGRAVTQVDRVGKGMPERAEHMFRPSFVQPGLVETALSNFAWDALCARGSPSMSCIWDEQQGSEGFCASLQPPVWICLGDPGHHLPALGHGPGRLRH